jgi:hypothetical protein
MPPMLVKRYTGLTIQIRKFELMDSFACGSRGEALFDHQFATQENNPMVPFATSQVVEPSSCLPPSRLRHNIPASCHSVPNPGVSGFPYRILSKVGRGGMGVV